MENNSKSNKDNGKFQNRASYVKCPECSFVRNVTPKKHKDPSWDRVCNKCSCIKNFKEKFPIGYKFENWTVKDHEFKRAGNYMMVNVSCSCGLETAVSAWTLENNKTKSCVKCSYVKKFKGCGEVSVTYFKQLKNAAKRRKHKFDITIEYIWELFLKQNRQCAISGRLLKLTNSNHFKTQTASLDRIDSNKGYLVGNLQWVDKEVNKLKMDALEGDLFQLIKEIYEFKQLDKLN